MPAAAAGLVRLAVDVAVVASHPPRTEGHTVNLDQLMLDTLRQDETTRARFLTDHATDPPGSCPCTLYSLAVCAGT